MKQRSWPDFPKAVDSVSSVPSVGDGGVRSATSVSQGVQSGKTLFFLFFTQVGKNLSWSMVT